MSREIERRFLVTGDGWRGAPSTVLAQAYLHAEPGCTIRVRLAEGIETRAWLTVKGPASAGGTTRDEFEYAIPPADARALFALATAGKVEKRRHVLECGRSRWEVDEFFGDNAGLVLAEIELEDPDQAFDRPDWLGPEVTHDPRYTNARLAACPFSAWTENASAGRGK